MLKRKSLQTELQNKTPIYGVCFPNLINYTKKQLTNINCHKENTFQQHQISELKKAHIMFERCVSMLGKYYDDITTPIYTDRDIAVRKLIRSKIDMDMSQNIFEIQHKISIYEEASLEYNRLFDTSIIDIRLKEIHKSYMYSIFVFDDYYSKTNTDEFQKLTNRNTVSFEIINAENEIKRLLTLDTKDTSLLTIARATRLLKLEEFNNLFAN